MVVVAPENGRIQAGKCCAGPGRPSCHRSLLSMRVGLDVFGVLE